MRKPLVVLLAVVVGFVGGSVLAQDADRVRPVDDLRYVRAEAGDSYYGLWSELGLSCSHTELWAANGRQPLDPGTIVLIPPWCAPAPQTTTTTATAPAATTTTRPPAPTTTTSTTVAPAPGEVRGRVGATVATQSGQSWASAWAAFESQIGSEVAWSRRFAPSFPASYQSVSALGASTDTGQRDRFLSVKGTPTRAQWTTFLNSIPRDGFDTWVTINHEPENDDGMTPTIFRQKLELMRSAIEATGRDDLHPAVVLMTWLEFDGCSATQLPPCGNRDTSEVDWFPEDPENYTLGLDPYDPESRRTGPNLTRYVVAQWQAAGGYEFMVTETGTKRTGVDGAAWIDEYFSWCRATPGCGGIAWFHAPNGDNGPWWLPTGVMSTIYGQQAQFAVAA